MDRTAPSLLAGHRGALTFARWLTLPENRLAEAAVREVAACVCSRRNSRIHNPLFLHGPPASGKSHLVHALTDEVLRRAADLKVALLSAADWNLSARPDPVELDGPAGHDLEEVRQADLLVVEDVQNLAAFAAETLVQALDYREVRGLQTVLTGNAGPQQLVHRHGRFPERLTSRLAAGLVVRLDPLGFESRLALLESASRQRRLQLQTDVLTWLAEHCAGGRQVLGTLAQLETLARKRPLPLDRQTVARYFHELDHASPAVERIADRVGEYFRVDPGQLRSPQRTRNVLWPRQVGMFLARQLTDLSLEQIGAYFGDRDHSTVLHACRKVQRQLNRDPLAAGAIRQLQAELT